MAEENAFGTMLTRPDHTQLNSNSAADTPAASIIWHFYCPAAKTRRRTGTVCGHGFPGTTSQRSKNETNTSSGKASKSFGFWKTINCGREFERHYDSKSGHALNGAELATLHTIEGPSFPTPLAQRRRR
jgi:hypothetical protein